MPRETSTPTKTTSDPRVGTVIRGKWHLDRVLGTGGMATVYAATHRVNGRRVALKLLHPEFARDAAVQERFLREGYVGNKIQHRGRVEVLDDDATEEGAPFLIMELLEGETIADLQKRTGRKMPVVKTLELAEQLLDALSACHAAGIVHRDLKPANVFITSEGVVKVLDFGVAQLREGQDQNHTRAGMALGTPSFMAPEQARGLGDKLDGRADLFSVGAMLYFMLSGVRLHKGRSNDEALVLAATQPAPSVARAAPELPVEVIALVDKALAWDRRNRYADAAEMRAVVLSLLATLRPQPAGAPAAVPGFAPGVAVPGFAPGVAAAPAAEAITDEHPDIQRLRGLFRQLDRLLASVRQYGWEHPETRRKLRSAFEELVRALDEAPEAVNWSVRPYSFLHRGLDVWEPAAPLDLVPWALFEAGVREMRVARGVSEEELRALVSVLLLDPGKDLAPEDDLATVLWEQDLPHVITACADDWAEGGAAQREAFYEASERLEQLADRAARTAKAEAKAMAVAVDRQAQGDAFAGALGLDATTRLALSSQFALSNELWTERYVDALADALVETARGGDPEPLLGALSASSSDLIVSGKVDVAVRLFEALLAVLRARGPQASALLRRVASAMFGGEALALLLRAASEPGAGPGPGLVRAVEVGLTQADAGAARAVLGALGSTDASMQQALLRYLTRVAAAAAEAIAAHAREASPELAQRLLQILAQAPGEACQQALDALAQGASPRMRLEVALLRGLSGEALARTVAPLLDDADPEVRKGALAAVAERRLKEVGPALARRAEDASFHTLGADERRALLDALWALNPQRAEAIVVALLGQRQVLKAEGRDLSRLIATQTLGAYAASPQALEALVGAQRGWWGVSDELKAAAQAAAQEVQARMNARKEGPR